jgi:hypothetical protein
LNSNTEMLNRLEEISTDFDNVIKTLRGSEADRQVKVRHWIITWLIIPFSTLFDLKGFVKGAKKMNLGPIVPVVAGTALAPLVGFMVDIPWYILALCGLLLGYLISFSTIAPKMMCTFNSEYFRIAAYALFRKQEYDLFRKGLLHENSLYFTPIYQQVALLMNKEDLSDKHLDLIHQRIDTFLTQEKMGLEAQVHALKEKLLELEDKHKKAINQYHQKVEALVDESLELHTGMGYVVDFIKATNVALYRKKNKLFNIADVSQMLSCGVTIYRKQDEWLIKEYDEGTTGASLTKYPLNETHSEYKEHAVVRAAIKEEDGLEEIDRPYGERFIIARKMKMDFGETWIINFHLDETAAKPLFLTVSNDILNTEEVFRMVHAICLLKQEADYMKGVS